MGVGWVAWGGGRRIPIRIHVRVRGVPARTGRSWRGGVSPRLSGRAGRGRRRGAIAVCCGMGGGGVGGVRWRGRVGWLLMGDVVVQVDMAGVRRGCGGAFGSGRARARGRAVARTLGVGRARLPSSLHSGEVEVGVGCSQMTSDESAC